MKYSQNSASINNVFTNIKDIVGTSYLNITVGDAILSTDRSSSNYMYLKTNNGDTSGTYNTTKSSSRSVKAVFIPHVQEI